MFYQLKKDEGMKALLKYSGGLEKDAFSSGVKIYRTELEKQVIVRRECDNHYQSN